MKPWPETPDPVYADNCFPFTAQSMLAYYRARGDSAIERLRLAVDALQKLSLGAERWTADEALEAIGEVPNE